MLSRSKHLKWCEERALQYLENNDLNNAFKSMISDLGEHPETSDHPAIKLGMIMMMSGNLNSKEKMKEFIKGFN